MRNYLRLVPSEHVIITSDAISAAGCGPGRYSVGDQPVTVGEDLVPRCDDHPSLAGSACTMRHMAENLRRHLGADDEQIRRWMFENPRRIIESGSG